MITQYLILPACEVQLNDKIAVPIQSYLYDRDTHFIGKVLEIIGAEEEYVTFRVKLLANFATTLAEEYNCKIARIRKIAVVRKLRE